MGSITSDDLSERTAKFGENIIDLCNNLPKIIITTPIVNQLLRSGTSIGANYAEANGASSKKDFRNKLHICKKESMETKFWLRMLARARVDMKKECQQLWKEAHEFTLIFSAAAKNSK